MVGDVDRRRSLLAPDQPAVSGREAIVRWARENLFDVFEIDDHLTSEELEVAGSWAWDRGRFIERLIPKAGGDAVETRGKYIIIFQRQDDGSWKWARVIFNSD